MPDFPMVGLISPFEGSVVMDGAEKIIFSDVRAGERIYRLYGFIDLSQMTEGDVIVVRQYVKLASDGAFLKYAEELYSGVQNLPALHILSTPYIYGVRITAQQIEGGYRTLRYVIFRQEF